MGRHKKYFTEEERKAAKAKSYAKYYKANKEKRAKYHTDYYQANKEKRLEYQAEYNKAHKDKYAEYYAEYLKTPIGRAANLVNNYKTADKQHNRGECTLTAKWVVENIFPKPCHYCGETGWEIMGCDRIDNSLPHTLDNVVPCCMDCNRKRHTKDYEEFKLMIEDGEIIKKIA